MRKFFVLATLLFSLCLANAQDVNLPRSLRTNERSTQDKSDRQFDFFVGGNINSNFGYNLAISPEIGIAPLDWLRIGVGPRYELSVLVDNQANRYTTHAFGAGAFVEGAIINYILIRAGYEFLNYPTNISIVADPASRNGLRIQSDRDRLHAISLGAGFQTHIADNLRLYALYIIYPYLTKNDYYSPLPMFARVGVTYDF